MRRRVRIDDWRLRHFQDVSHCLVGNMREVHHHAESIHLPDHLYPLVAQSTPLCPTGRRGTIRISVVARMRKRDIPHAQPMVRPHHRGRVSDLVQTLDADHRRNLPVAMCSHGSSGRRGEGQDVGVLVDEPVDELDLLERPPHQVEIRGVVEVARVRGTRHKHAPEHAADVPALEPRDVDVPDHPGAERKVRSVYLVVEFPAHEDREINVRV